MPVRKRKSSRRATIQGGFMKFQSLAAGVFSIFAAALSAHACTSWMIHPSVSRSGMMIVQKVRDHYHCQLDADMRVAPNGWRWMRIGLNKHNSAFSMNEKGVVMTTNDGDFTDVRHPRNGIRAGYWSGAMIRRVITTCATAAEGAELIKNIARNGLTAGSNGIYFIADPNRAFMINLAFGYAEVKELTDGMIVITNAWHLPGGEEISTKSLSGLRGDRAREANTRASLQQARIDGKYTIRGCIDTSRRAWKKDSVSTYFPFRYNPKSKVSSLSSVCFEIDREFPAYLSCGYTALGPQQHTIFLPIPMALEQMPDKMRSGEWGQMAYDIRRAFGSDHRYVEEFRKLEDKFLQEFSAERDKARRLLKAGNRAEAAKILNECFARQFAEADKLLSQVHAAAMNKSNEQTSSDK